MNVENSTVIKAPSVEGLKAPKPEPLAESSSTASFMGVELEKGIGGAHTPRPERFRNNVLTEYDYKLMQKIAVAWDLKQPVLIESGSGLGKTETVDRMCSILGWDCYYANCHNFEPDVLIGGKTVREDTKSGFGWKDGIILQWIRNGGVLFLDEYNFMRGETRGRLHEVLDLILSGKDEIVLIENNGERVKLHPNCRLVAAQNPPGGDFTDREILDPPQITRFVYLKEPTEMPRELKEARALGLLGTAKPIEISDAEYLSSHTKLTMEQLKQIPGIDAAMRQFLEFEHAMDKLLQAGKIGEDQPQPVRSAFQRDFNKVVAFVARYYEGDIYDTLKKAIHYYYENRFESKTDRARVRELTRLIRPPEKADAGRIAVNPGSIQTSLVLVARSQDPDLEAA